MGQATPVIATIAIIVVAVVAPEILPAIAEIGGEAAAVEVLEGAAAAEASTTAGMVQAAAEKGALSATEKAVATGALKGAASSAVQGRDPITGAALGGLTSGIGAEFGPELGPTATGAVTGGIRAGLTGQDVIRGAGMGGATAGFTDLLFGDTKDLSVGEKIARDVGGAGFSMALADYFSPKTQPTGTYTPTTQYVGTAPTGEPTMGIAAPGSQALAQTLRLGSGEPGAPIESPGGGEKATKPVWNIASLRVKDETGGEA